MNQKEWTEEVNDKSMEEAKNAILDGKIIAHVQSVSQSGMSRRILFFYIKDESLVRCTPAIAWLTGKVSIGEYKQGGKQLIDDGLRVSECGQDMVFATLYDALQYEEAKNWNQKYNTL